MIIEKIILFTLEDMVELGATLMGEAVGGFQLVSLRELPDDVHIGKDGVVRKVFEVRLAPKEG